MTHNNLINADLAKSSPGWLSKRWTNDRQAMTIDAAVDQTKDEISCDLKTFLNGSY